MDKHSRVVWCLLMCVYLSSSRAADPVTKDTEDNQTVDDVIDLDDSSVTGNDSLLEAADGKIILETYPTKLVEASRDIISDDVDGFIGSGSGFEEEASNVTESEPFTSLKTSAGPSDTTPYITASPVIEEHDDDDVEASANTEIVTVRDENTVTEEPLSDENANVFDDPDKIPNFLKLCEKKNCRFGGVCVPTGDESVECACPLQCANEFGNQLCGSDGTTYPSPCHMEQQACEQQRNITRADYRACAPYETFCGENREPSWSSWSIWLQSGSTDFRIRYCKVGGSVAESSANCGNDRIEVRPCKKRDVMPCSSDFGEESQQFNYECAGTDMQDVQAIDQLFDGKLADEVECKFSLYDAGLQKFVHSNWTWKTLKEKGDQVIWCNHRAIFVPFSSTPKHCHDKLEAFCKKETVCRPRKKIMKNKGDRKHKCWKKFLLDEVSPKGFPNVSDKYHVCQRFAPGTEFADIFGPKSTQFATIYDTVRRTPLMSFARFKDLGDSLRPTLPFMLEKGLLPFDYNLFSLFFEKKRKGMIQKTETKQEVCQTGLYQSLQSDYDESKYHILHLHSPDIAGFGVSKRIATYTMTNTLPIHISLYSAWNQAVQNVRHFAIDHCSIPIYSESDQNKKRRQSHDYPEVYVISGAVASTNPEVLLNKRVNVPYLIWMAACCVRGAETSSFSVYVRNEINSPIIIAPVVQLEVLLSDLYNDGEQNSVKLFPAYEGVCSNIQHDVSQVISA